MRTGTQSIERTIRILKAIAERKNIGWRTTDLAKHCGLEKTTTHRILRCLAAERLLRQREGDRRYIPGPVLFELASALPSYMGFRDALHQELVGIARRYDCIAFLHLRSGIEIVCIDRVGTSNVHPLTVVGTRRVLTESTAGVAMLLAMSKEERDATLASIQKLGKGKQATRQAIAYRRVWEKSRKAGYAISSGDVVSGMGALAIALLDPAGCPCITIGIMGPMAQITGDKLNRCYTSLLKDSRRIAREYAALIAGLATELDAK